MITIEYRDQALTVKYGEGLGLWGTIIETRGQRLTLSVDQTWALYRALTLAKDHAAES